MNKILIVYEQQSWHPRLNVEIREGAKVTINGEDLVTDREQALGNIILRLNAYKKANEEEKKNEEQKQSI